MALKKDVSQAAMGMQRDKAPSDLTQGEYTFSLNLNRQDSHDGGPRYNEPSNIKCSGFKPGFLVTGHGYDVSSNKVYFFLNNPTTGCSEIGYIDINVDISDAEAISESCNCNISVILEEPLEGSEYQAICNYVTVLSDYCETTGTCSGCLGFSVDTPIYPHNVHFKVEKASKEMFFSQAGKPLRYVQLDRLDYYTTSQEACEDPVASCLDCNKLRVFPLFEVPCLHPEIIQNGGNLRAGLYEALISFSNSSGDSFTSCYSLTNPIAIHDKNNNILDQTNLDYQTNQAIKLVVDNPDTTFQYFTIYVIYRNALDSSVSYIKYNTYPADTKSITINTLVDKERVNASEIISRQVSYDTVNGLTSANGYLFPYGLTSKRTINLQPVVNLMGFAMRWMTYQAKEKLYEDGVYISNYMSYLRDEVYPVGIQPVMDGGHELPLFTFIPRPPLPSEVAEMSPEDLNFLSVTTGSPYCGEVERKYKWQFENTAITLGECPVPTDSGLGTITETRTVETSCFLNTDGEPTVVDTVASGSITVPAGVSVVQYVNNNAADIITSTDPSLAGIKAVLEDPTDYPGNCTPVVGDNCEEPVLLSEEIFAIDVDSEVAVKKYFDFSEYSRVKAPESCNTFKLDTFGNPVVDSTFVLNYMEPGEVVYERSTVPTNMACATAKPLLLHTNPQVDNYNFLLNKGELNNFLTLVDPAITVSATNANFTSNLHKNAIWFKVDFNGAEKIIVELSPTFCNNPDDNTGSSLRMSLFANCGAAFDISTYGRIIADMSLPNDPLKWVELNASDFPSGTAYIAIDGGLYQRTLTSTDESYTLKPVCGCFSIYYKDAEFNTLIDFTNLTFGKRQTYTVSCEFAFPNLNNCGAIPHKYGLFSHWESTEKYPCNKHLYDSSWLKIQPENIPLSYRSEFEDYYVVGGSAFPAVDLDGNYVLNAETDFQDKAIRHFKFPDNREAPFINGYASNPGDFKDSTIYPIGLFISNEIINAFLDIAVANGLLTVQERLQIKRYEIFRGDRAVDKSILAKGLMFDVYSYFEIGSGKFVEYPNYPLNGLGFDAYNIVQHPYGSTSNARFTFHSPDTHFYKPTLPRELYVEGYQFGKSRTIFDEVEDHPTYVLLSSNAYAVATTLAIAEVSFEAFLQTTEFVINATAGGTAIGSAAAVIIAIAAGVVIVTQSVLKVGEYRYRWLDTFKNLGRPKNFAYYSATIGHYNHFLPNTVSNSLTRGLTISQYLKPGYLRITEEATGVSANLNNLDRESSVYLKTGAGYNIFYPPQYYTYDTGSSRPTYPSGVGRSQDIVGNAASPYVSLKQYLPAQYGSINSIEWVFTNYCGKLQEDNECVAVFGGDTFISRFAVKRKLPYFNTTAFGLAPLTPYKYSDYFNINPDITIGRYFLDFEVDDDEYTLSSFVFPENKSQFNLDGYTAGTGFYISPPAKFYLYSYGFPHFLVESSINCNFRYAKRELHENFYPNNLDIIDYTQEKNVPIREREEFFYNFVYSFGHTKYPYTTLPSTFDPELWEGLNNLENAVIYSNQDNSETSLDNPWLVYKPLNFYQFPTSYGKLKILDGIESEQVLGLFENGFTVFGAIDQLRDRVAPEQSSLGNGGVFTGRNINFNKTDLGYAGTQHSTKVSCEFGHFWVDAKRGDVFLLGPNASSLTSITIGLSKWFKEHLPFKILKQFPEVDVDNTYKWFGIVLGWDERLKRLFLTKKDYKSKGNVCYSNGVFYSTVGYEDQIAAYIASGYKYEGIVDCKLQFKNIEGVIRVDLDEVEVTDSEFFTDCSFTVGYDPVEQRWLSYYSFKPSYYISYEDYFQTGVNFSEDPAEFGLWSHYPHISSHQVFYGKLYPFIIEYPLQSQLIDSVPQDVNYLMEVKKYYNRYDFSDIVGFGFNKAYIYNNHQNSGLLNLIHNDANNMFLSINYPKHNADSTDILQTEVNGRYSFNYFYNLIRNEKSGMPVWKYDCAQVMKEIDNTLLDFRPTYKDRLRGDYFLVRLIQDKESRYKMLFRMAIDNRDFYQD